MAHQSVTQSHCLHIIKVTGSCCENPVVERTETEKDGFSVGGVDHDWCEATGSRSDFRNTPSLALNASVKIVVI